MEKIKLTIKSLGKTLFWTAWNTGFGLAPVWYLYFRKSINTETKWLTDKFIVEKNIDDCLVMFFCAAIMAEVAIDCVLAKHKFGRFFLLTVTGLSLFTLFIVSTIFGQTFFNSTGLKTTNETYFTINFYQNTLAFGAGLFCLIFKTILFYFEER
ncbi:MAG: hypothetical protein M3R72_08095 [Bacteroidota bacterium]|nr:hypothetical protein [Bacteroidota bacterium]